MKPKQSPQDQPGTIQLFQSRLDTMINLDHPLCHLSLTDKLEITRFLSGAGA